jgi:hypothetical protein
VCVRLSLLVLLLLLVQIMCLAKVPSGSEQRTPQLQQQRIMQATSSRSILLQAALANTTQHSPKSSRTKTATLLLLLVPLEIRLLLLAV